MSFSRLLRRVSPVCLAALLILMTAACGQGAASSVPGVSSGGASSSASPSASSSQPSHPGSDISQPDPPGPDVSQPDPSGSTGPADPAVPPVSTYDFSQPAPESEAVDNDYFADAAFVGDSRTDGFLLFSGIGKGKNLTSNGISIYKLAEKKALQIGGESYTLLEALALEQYAKVYICLGVNELGYNDDPGFYRAYCQAIDAIRACQPNAVIYIQNLIPVNESVIAATGGKSYLTNEHLRVYNDLLRQVAKEKQVVLVDLYSEFERDGILPADASKDGVHLTSAYCRQWLAYLKTHTVDFDTLYPGGISQVQEVPAS